MRNYNYFIKFYLNRVYLNLTGRNILENNKYLAEIEKYRKIIDSLDLKLLAILNERIGVVDKISEIKKTNNIPVVQKERFEMMLKERVKVKGELSSEFIKDLFELIHFYTVNLQLKNREN